jgi:hypothetical protein
MNPSEIIVYSGSNRLKSNIVTHFECVSFVHEREGTDLGRGLGLVDSTEHEFLWRNKHQNSCDSIIQIKINLYLRCGGTFIQKLRVKNRDLTTINNKMGIIDDVCIRDVGEG